MLQWICEFLQPCNISCDLNESRGLYICHEFKLVFFKYQAFISSIKSNFDNYYTYEFYCSLPWMFQETPVQETVALLF